MIGHDTVDIDIAIPGGIPLVDIDRRFVVVVNVINEQLNRAGRPS